MRLRLAIAGMLSTLAPFAAHAAEEGGEKKGMPQLDPSSFASQIFWLAVFFALFYGFMSFVAMPRLQRILKARQARISDDLYHATTASGDAAALKTELETSLGHARDEARNLLAAANDDIRRQAATSDAELSAELTARIEKAEEAIQTARSEAMGSIEQIASGILAGALPKIASVTANDAEIRGAVAKAAGGKT